MYQGERFNSITHLVGSVLALCGASVAITLAAQRGGWGRITAVAIYGAMLFVLYLSSTLYHSLRGKPKRLFHVFDHCAIYLLIAGTYTPFTLVTLRGGWGWSLFAIVWALAMAGIVFKFWFIDHFQILSTALYLAMSWVALVAMKPLLTSIPPHGDY